MGADKNTMWCVMLAQEVYGNGKPDFLWNLMLKLTL